MPAPLPVGAASVPLPSGADKKAASAGTPSPQPSTNKGASVKVFDEFEYLCKPGDTFASISKQFLMSEKYAKALQRHNQNHARANEQMASTGKLTPGEKIYIPQTGILEERYADVIEKPAATPSSPTVPATFVTPGGSPPPVAPPSPPPSPTIPATSRPAPLPNP